MLFFATNSYLLSVTYLIHSKVCVNQIPWAKMQTMWFPSTIVWYAKKNLALKSSVKYAAAVVIFCIVP